MNASTTRLVSSIVIAGSQAAIWRELTKQGEPQAAVFNAWLHAQALLPGKPMQMRTRTGNKVIVVGEVIELDPPRRFVHSFRFTQYDDPPCIVTYELEPAPGGTKVTLIVDNLPVHTPTAKSMTRGSTQILGTLKDIVESGRPRLPTRIMYAMFDKLEFVLPRRCDARHWPMEENGP